MALQGHLEGAKQICPNNEGIQRLRICSSWFGEASVMCCTLQSLLKEELENLNLPS
jgi:hypothetical protein